MVQFVSLSTIINDLLLVVRGSKVSQSEAISTRQLEAWIHQYRALLLKQDLDKNKMPNPDYIQEIDYLKLSLVDIGGENAVSGIPETGFSVLKTDLAIPKTIDLNHKSGLMYVGNVAGNEIQLVSESRSKWQSYKKYTAKVPITYLKGGYLYISGVTDLDYITVRGVFEIPSEVGNFVNPITNQPSYDINSKYPIPANMLPVLKEMILSKELGIEVRAPSDTVNDSVSNVLPNIETQLQPEGN